MMGQAVQAQHPHGAHSVVEQNHAVAAPQPAQRLQHAGSTAKVPAVQAQHSHGADSAVGQRLAAFPGQQGSRFNWVLDSCSTRGMQRNAHMLSDQQGSSLELGTQLLRYTEGCSATHIAGQQPQLGAPFLR